MASPELRSQSRIRVELPSRSLDLPRHERTSALSGHSKRHRSMGRLRNEERGHASNVDRVSARGSHSSLRMAKRQQSPTTPMTMSSATSSINGSPPPSPRINPMNNHHSRSANNHRFNLGSLLLARKSSPSPGRKLSNNSLKRASFGSVMRDRLGLRTSTSSRGTATPPASLYDTETMSSRAYDDDTISGLSERDDAIFADGEMEDDDDDMAARGITVNIDDDSDSDESLRRFEEGPLELHYESLAGQKHVYPNGVTMNEDNASTFDLQVGGRWARCFYVADGHGEVIDKRLVRPGYVSYGRHFVDLLDQVLPDVVQSILESEAISITENGDEDIARRVTTALGDLNIRLNEAVAELDPDVCAENGSTLCLGILYRGHLFCCSIGDSSMFMADPDGLPMRVWCRRGKDNVLNVCSFEDTLDMYPVRLRQGQNLRALRRDFTELQGRVKTVREMGCNVYLVVSDRSGYALRMTNTLGNFNHAGWTLSRTNVYSMPLARLPPNTTLMFVTDGIKDLMDVEELSRFTVNIRDGVVPPEYQIPNTRRRWGSRDPAIELDRFLEPRREYLSQPQYLAYRNRLLELLRRDSKRPSDMLPHLSDVCSSVILSALVRYASDDLTVLAVRLPGQGSADAAMRSIRPRPHSWQERRPGYASRPASIASASSFGGGSAFLPPTDAELAEMSPAEALRRRKRDSAPADLFRGVLHFPPSGDESDPEATNRSFSGSLSPPPMMTYSPSSSPPSGSYFDHSPPPMDVVTPALTPAAITTPVPTPSMNAATAARLASINRSKTVRPRTHSAYLTNEVIGHIDAIDLDGYASAASNSSAPVDPNRRRKRSRNLVFRTPSLKTLRNLFRKHKDGTDGTAPDTMSNSSPLRYG